MNTIDQLQHEHAQLRRSLALVDTTIQIGVPAWPILQEACVNLATQLEQHVAREEPIRLRYMRRARKGVLREEIPGHQEQTHQVLVILRHLLVDKDVLLKDVDGTLYSIVEELQQQLEEQEQQLLPAVEREITNL